MQPGPDRHQHAVSDAADAVSEQGGETASEKIQPTGRSVPDTEVAAGAKRRRFSAEYKMRIVGQAGRCREPGEIGSLLRREGLYSSHLAKWRAEHARGAMKALAGSNRGPRPKRQAAEIENERLRRTIGRLEVRLRQAERIIDIQKKVSEILGIPLMIGQKAKDDSSA